MKKALLALFVTLGMVVAGQVQAKLTCPAFDGIKMSAQDRQLVEKEADKWLRSSRYAAVMKRIALYKGDIDYLCSLKGIEPFFIYGLVPVESSGDPEVLDHVYGRYAGLLQIGPGMISAEDRFKIYENLEIGIRYFAYNYRRTSDYTLAVVAHHGGTNSPLRQAAFYRYGGIGAEKEKRAERWLKTHHPGYFTLRRWELSHKKYWSQKADGHLNYPIKVLGAMEAFWRYWYHGKRPDPRQGYRGEVDFELARHVEHTAWYLAPKYNCRADLIKAAQKGEIVEAPNWLAEAGIKLDQGRHGIGWRDKRHQYLYRMAKPAVWGMLRELGERTLKEYPKRRMYRVESLTRHKNYLSIGSKTTSHNSSGAVDIDLNTSCLSVRELTVLHRTLYRMASEGKLTYYIESDSSFGGCFATFKVPYNFRHGGQVHIVVNPRQNKHFKQVYACGGGKLPVMTCSMMTLPQLGQKGAFLMELLHEAAQFFLVRLRPTAEFIGGLLVILLTIWFFVRGIIAIPEDLKRIANRKNKTA